MMNEISMELNNRGYKAESTTVVKNGVEKVGVIIGEGTIRPTIYPNLNHTVNECVSEIINTYENTIEKLNIGYKDSKNKYISVINQRDIETKELVMNHRNDTDKLNSTIAELKATIDSLRDDQEKLMKMNNEQKAEIDTLNESLERSKKEIKFHIREKSKIEKDSEVLQKDLSQLKVQNEKMHRLTHGKFRRQKSTEK